ncbi:PAS domain-containing sensor histidine kinase [Bacillus sp. V3-13]|uniref:ATP-binding protein n=1 Tax=Bacillus sp. V3-13 TaxID=2053728 RepID=UPI000C76CE3C|nr:ATP-binding protein [Bacillus sp. V3-13]PLR75197.1 PAS domain-containing sensor histidine kinase [Bacillus sp. V3-13]
MENQLALIGRKIQAFSYDLAMKTSEIPAQQYLQEYIFNLVGDFLCHKNESIRTKIIPLVSSFPQNPDNKSASLEQCNKFIAVSRSMILEFLEEEVDKCQLAANILIQIMKLADHFYQMFFNAITNPDDDSLSLSPCPLQESNDDVNAALKELSDFKKALIEATIFSITDKDNYITYVNDQFCEISKFTKAELMGHNHHILNSQFHSESFFNNLCGTIEKGETWKGEILNQAKDGTKFWVDTTIVPFVNKNGEIYQFFYIQYDITEKKETEETLRKAEQLSMVGDLAAGIAHEIRNPLTSIKGFVQLMNETDKGKVFTDIILEEIDRINFIVSEFMVFSKPHTYYLSECNVAETLLSVIKFLQPEALLKNVAINYKLPQSKVHIFGEKNQLKQVFLNIIKNAVEALPNGGEIFIGTEINKQKLSISIQDNGVGMSPEELKKIGKPFYTTKEKGNGLGLMVSYQIVQKHNGIITVQSVLGEGTIFMITFPLTPERKQ